MPLPSTSANPFKRHWNDNGAEPAAFTANVATLPATTVWSTGCDVIDGGVLTVRIAPAFVVCGPVACPASRSHGAFPLATNVRYGEPTTSLNERTVNAAELLVTLPLSLLTMTL
jgi:hypothetical protein